MSVQNRSFGRRTLFPAIRPFEASTESFSCRLMFNSQTGDVRRDVGKMGLFTGGCLRLPVIHRE